MPDTYLDELQEMLVVTCGVQVSKSTVWHALRSGGFTLKKVHHRTPNTSSALTNLFDSSPVLQQSVQLRRDSNISQGLASMMPVNSFLWMKARSIAGQHTEGAHGLFMALRLKGRPFLYEVVGK